MSDISYNIGDVVFWMFGTTSSAIRKCDRPVGGGASFKRRIGDSAAGHSHRYVRITGSENWLNAGTEIVR